ncbi:MAG: G8 domain-containing protein [Pseudomonadales bacterium]|nr:G8 domain-containing protein [Pseudomonadales bacterium]
MKNNKTLSYKLLSIIILPLIVTACGIPEDPEPGGDSGSGHQHDCMMTPEFVDLSLMTHTAAQSGDWSNLDTWGGSLPGNGAVVHIPEGMEVTIRGVQSARLETVRIDGALKFSTDTNTELQVDTLFSACSGLLEMGTESQPIQENVKARVVFIDDGAVADTKRMSRGAVLMGQTIVQGATKTHRAILSPHAQAGDAVISLSLPPMGWQIGDQLVITGTQFNNPESDEIRTITDVQGNQITLHSPLALDHNAPKQDLNVYVANVTRNVEFISENLSIQHRGHIMFMSHDVNVQNARFTELGRTDKTRALDDFQFEFHDGGVGDDAPATADVVDLGGANIRGRYAIHFHRNGTDSSTAPALVKGSVVFNGPGWGFVNHSSNVDFIDNVSYGLQGAGFYTEAGDEIGSMQGNIAIRSVNSSFTIDHLGAIDPDLRAEFMDYGNDGDGFWLTGNRVSMINNVAAGASAHGIIYWTDGIMEPEGSAATRVSIPVSSLANGHLIPNRESVPVWWAPFAESRGNESYGATVGFRIRYVHAKNYLGREEQSDFHRSPPQAYIDTLTPTINDLTVWGSRDGVLLNYNERMNVIGARVVGPGKELSEFQFNEGTAKSGVGFDIGNESTHGPGRMESLSVEGFGMGFVTPVNGIWDIRNLTLRENDTDILIQPVETEPTQVRIQNSSYDSFQVYEEDDSGLPDHILITNAARRPAAR